MQAETSLSVQVCKCANGHRSAVQHQRQFAYIIASLIPYFRRLAHGTASESAILRTDARLAAACPVRARKPTNGITFPLRQRLYLDHQLPVL